MRSLRVLRRGRSLRNRNENHPNTIQKADLEGQFFDKELSASIGALCKNPVIVDADAPLMASSRQRDVEIIFGPVAS